MKLLKVKNDEITKIFNKHFMETVGKLNIFKWPSCKSEYTEDQLTNIIDKYKSHPSIKKLKATTLLSKNFLLSKLLLRILKMLLKYSY